MNKEAILKGLVLFFENKLRDKIAYSETFELNPDGSVIVTPSVFLERTGGLLHEVADFYSLASILNESPAILFSVEMDPSGKWIKYVVNKKEVVESSEKKPIKENDLVQWVSQSTDQFEEPRRVISISTDGQYAFVEGASTGILVSELVNIGD